MSDEQIYYIVFSDSHSYFLGRFFKPGFRHVHAIHHHGGHWYLIDPSLKCLHHLPLTKEKGIDFISAYAEMFPDKTILKVYARENPDMPVWRIGAISCVSTIQYLLGIYWPLTVTPWQLYCKLKDKTPAHVRIVKDGWQQRSRESTQGSGKRSRSTAQANRGREEEGGKRTRKSKSSSSKKPESAGRRIIRSQSNEHQARIVNAYKPRTEV